MTYKKIFIKIIAFFSLLCFLFFGIQFSLLPKIRNASSERENLKEELSLSEQKSIKVALSDETSGTLQEKEGVISSIIFEKDKESKFFEQIESFSQDARVASSVVVREKEVNSGKNVKGKGSVDEKRPQFAGVESVPVQITSTGKFEDLLKFFERLSLSALLFDQETVYLKKHPDDDTQSELIINGSFFVFKDANRE